MKVLTCTHCGAQMRFFGRECVQLGKTGMCFGEFPDLLSGVLDVCIYICPHCRRLEFFLAEDEEATDGLVRTKSSDCPEVHGFGQAKGSQCNNN